MGVNTRIAVPKNYRSKISKAVAYKKLQGILERLNVVVKLNWPRFCIQASIFALTRSVSAHRYIDAV